MEKIDLLYIGALWGRGVRVAQWDR